jgi:hypothetical protein
MESTTSDDSEAGDRRQEQRPTRQHPELPLIVDDARKVSTFDARKVSSF